MPKITRHNDAYGHQLWAHLIEGPQHEIVERDDGFITTSNGPTRYFADFDAWAQREKLAMSCIEGSRVLDIGSGAGRVSLHLQREGLKVTAIDSSPLAIRVCRKRGVDNARVLPIERIHRLPPGTFDTVVMFGNNFGLFASRRKAQRLLRVLHRRTSSNAVILAESLDPYGTRLIAHRRYQRRNRQRGRMGGQIRIRVRFRAIKGPWFDYLLVSPEEMKGLLAAAGWTIREIISTGGPEYIAVIAKSDRG